MKRAIALAIIWAAALAVTACTPLPSAFVTTPHSSEAASLLGVHTGMTRDAARTPLLARGDVFFLPPSAHIVKS